MVNNLPCFFKPYKNTGILSSKRNTDRDIYSGVIWDNSIDVPDIPLSYNLTGVKKIVTPKALIIPASVSMITFLTCIFFNISILSPLFNINEEYESDIVNISLHFFLKDV